MLGWAGLLVRRGVAAQRLLEKVRRVRGSVTRACRVCFFLCPLAVVLARVSCVLCAVRSQVVRAGAGLPYPTPQAPPPGESPAVPPGAGQARTGEGKRTGFCDVWLKENFCMVAKPSVRLS